MICPAASVSWSCSRPWSRSWSRSRPWETLENVAVTDRVPFIVTEHVVPLPSQAPSQPVKRAPLSARAVSATRMPAAKRAEQLAPQRIPAGVLVTVPRPEPRRVTVRLAPPGVVAEP